MLYFLDLLGTFAFAVTGAYKAKGARLHIFGVIFLGIITAVGGGTFRDVAIGRTPLFYFQDANYLLLAILAGVVIYFAPTFFAKQYSLFRFIDSVGLAAFVIIGVSVANLSLFGGDHFSFISLLVSVFLVGLAMAGKRYFHRRHQPRWVMFLQTLGLVGELFATRLWEAFRFRSHMDRIMFFRHFGARCLFIF